MYENITVIGKVLKVLYFNNGTNPIYQIEFNGSIHRVYDNSNVLPLRAETTYHLNLTEKDQSYYLNSYEVEEELTKEDVLLILKFFSLPDDIAKELYQVKKEKTIQALKNGDIKSYSQFLEEFESKISKEQFETLLIVIQENSFNLTHFAKISRYGVPTNTLISYFMDQHIKRDRLLLFLENPYILSKYGMRYRTLDKIYKKMGGNLISKTRLRYAILESLRLSEDDGNTFTSQKNLYRNTIKLYYEPLKKDKVQELLDNTQGNFIHSEFDNTFIYTTRNYLETKMKETKQDYYSINFIPIDFKVFHTVLNNLISKQELILETEGSEKRYYRHDTFKDEIKIAEHLMKLINNKHSVVEDIESHKETINNFLEENDYLLEDKQLEAVIENTSYLGGVSYINGGAGRGKTFTVNIILEVLKIIYPDIIITLAAPTGRAAKRMNEMIDDPFIKAQTIHSHLNLGTIKADVLIVDETSMVDNALMCDLLSIIENDTKVIFVGHDRQLESVQAGRVFADIIHSGIIPGVELEVAKRFKQNSSIFRNAENILNYKNIYQDENDEDSMIYFTEESEETLELLVKNYTELINNEVDVLDIQVLVPMLNGMIGTNYINFVLQKISNNFSMSDDSFKSKEGSITINDKKETFQLNFYKNDKVINTKNLKEVNRYQKYDDQYEIVDDNGYIANGEIGIITDFEIVKNGLKHEKAIMVKFDDYYYAFNEREAKKLLLHAYAISIHKSQGSEWPITFLLIDQQHRHMVKNNLLYTGYTRSSDFQFTIGNKSVIETGVKRKTEYVEGVANKDVRDTHLINRIIAAHKNMLYDVDELKAPISVSVPDNNEVKDYKKIVHNIFKTSKTTKKELSLS